MWLLCVGCVGLTVCMFVGLCCDGALWLALFSFVLCRPVAFRDVTFRFGSFRSCGCCVV